MKQKILAWLTMCGALLPVFCRAQVNSGSNGSDGVFNPTTNTVINMADHPDGIYHYISVNIPSMVTVTFIPNANNSCVVWLVQSNVVINGTVDVSGQSGNGGTGGVGGPGGYRGGNAGTLSSPGQGPGGGATDSHATSGSYATFGGRHNRLPEGAAVYGNIFVVPLVGGSGGGGARAYIPPGYVDFGGGGGGGALLIAASKEMQLNGKIYARGGQTRRSTVGSEESGGGGSGGAVRLIASRITGFGGTIDAGPDPLLVTGSPITQYSEGGMGRVRLDSPDLNYSGTVIGASSQGYQPIIIPSAEQGAQLAITSVGGVPVSASPTGTISTPDAILPAQQNNPVPIVVHCSNIPLNTQITVSVKPANGPAVSAMGLNNTGTLASSTATVLINMPRGGGIIYATAAN